MTTRIRELRSQADHDSIDALNYRTWGMHPQATEAEESAADLLEQAGTLEVQGRIEASTCEGCGAFDTGHHVGFAVMEGRL